MTKMCTQGEIKSSATKGNETEDLQKWWIHFLITILTLKSQSIYSTLIITDFY